MGLSNPGEKILVMLFKQYPPLYKRNQLIGFVEDQTAREAAPPAFPSHVGVSS